MAEMVRDFNHMIDSLETLDREQRVTLASISHELRTPIAVLSARLHAICDGVIPVSDEEMRGLLDQSLHLGRLVADLHTLSLASVGRLSLQTRPVDLVALVGDALTSFEARLAEKGFEVDTQLPASAQGKLIMADRTGCARFSPTSWKTPCATRPAGAGSAWKCAYTPDRPCWR